MADNSKVLGPVSIDASSCADLSNLASQVQTAFQGFPAPDPGPGPDGNPQGIPVEIPYQSQVCLTSNYTSGVATAEYVDEYFVAIPGSPTLNVPDPTRRLFHPGTIAIVSGVVTLSGTAEVWPTWAASGSINVEGSTYTVNTRDSDTQVTLNDTSLNVSSTASYTLREDTGTLEGTGNGDCGTVDVTPSDDGSGNDEVAVTDGSTYVNQIVVGGSYTATAPIAIDEQNDITIGYGTGLELSGSDLIADIDDETLVINTNTIEVNLDNFTLIYDETDTEVRVDYDSMLNTDAVTGYLSTDRQALYNNEDTLSWVSGCRIVKGQATAAFDDTDATFTIDNLTVLHGPGGLASSITVDNEIDFSGDNNGIVYAIQHANSDTWYVFQAQCPA